jgi:hypothetical protein
VKWVDVWSVDASLVIDATLALGCGGASVEWDGETRNGITWVGSDVSDWVFFLGSEVDTRNARVNFRGEKNVPDQILSNAEDFFKILRSRMLM